MRFPKLSALALAATLAFPAFAVTEATNGFAITSTGTGNTFRDTSNATSNPDWISGLGSIMQGSFLWLGGQVTTTPGGGPANGFDVVTMDYKIDNGTTQSVNLKFNGNTNGNTSDMWETLATSTTPSFAGVEVGSMLGFGTHMINVWFTAVDNSIASTSNVPSGTVLLDNGGQGWTASVTVVPEPASGALILAGLGMIGVMAKRRRVVG